MALEDELFGDQERAEFHGALEVIQDLVQGAELSPGENPLTNRYEGTTAALATAIYESQHILDWISDLRDEMEADA